MNIIDVCESDSDAGCLKVYYRYKKITDYKIIGLGLFLQIGDIKDDHLKFLSNNYDEGYNDYKDINELFNCINDNTKIRIWSSYGNASEYLLVLYLCDLLKDKTSNISVVNVTDYDKNAFRVGSISFDKVELALKYERSLTQKDINNYSSEWKKLVEVNSELRVLKNDVIINKKYSDYDNIILDTLSKILSEEKNCRFIDLTASLMGNCVINFSDSFIYAYLIDRLIEQNKIKIIEKKERHYYDLIDLNM